MPETLPARVAAIQTAFDREVNEWRQRHAARGRKLFCARGCCGCCTLYVETTLAEALQIAEHLDETAVARLTDYAQQLLTIAGESFDLKKLLQRHREKLVCPFLDRSGACAIYAIRPLACRALLSTRPADWCSVDFSEMSRLEKDLYRSALDPEQTDGLTHYVAATRERAGLLEETIDTLTRNACGCTLRGNLPLLVLFARHAGLNRPGSKEPKLRAALDTFPSTHPLLIHFLPNA